MFVKFLFYSTMKIILLINFFISILYASDINNTFDNAKLYNEIRITNVYYNHKDLNDTYSTAIGGSIKYEQQMINNLKFGVAAYFSKKVNPVSGNNEKLNYDFLNNNGNGYLYLGEAYIDYTIDQNNLKIGRQTIETPFIAGCDIRMNPNTYEAITYDNSNIDNTHLILGYAKKWAGFFSSFDGESMSKFKDLKKDSSGALMIGLTTSYLSDIELESWFYSIDKLADIYYFDSEMDVFFENNSMLEILLQYAHFGEKNTASNLSSNVDGDVYGISLTYKNDLAALGIAANYGVNKPGKYPSIGFGGGPFVSTMEEFTINGMENVRSLYFKADFDLKHIGFDDSDLLVEYGRFSSSAQNAKLAELDIVLNYAITQDINLEINYADLKDINHNFSYTGDGSYKRILSRMSFKF